MIGLSEAAVSGDVPEVDGVHYRLVDTIGEVVTVARRVRRFWSEDEKRRIVARTCAPGVSVSQVGRRYDVNANLIFTWRRDPRYKPAADLRPGRTALDRMNELLKRYPLPSVSYMRSRQTQGN